VSERLVFKPRLTPGVRSSTSCCLRAAGRPNVAFDLLMTDGIDLRPWPHSA
jgi:hypothetical protein